MSFVGIAVEIDHVAGLAGRLRPGVHGDADIGLRERRSVVGAVTDHRDQFATFLFLADPRQFVLGLRLGDEVVHARLGGDGTGGERIVPRDHHGPDAHRAELGEPFLDPAFHNILEQNDSEHAVILGHDERGAAGARDLVHLVRNRRGIGAALGKNPGLDTLGRAFPDAPAVQVHAAHAGLRGERHKSRVRCGDLPSPQLEFLLGQRDDAAALGRFVGERGQLRGIGQRSEFNPRRRDKLGRHAIAQRDRARLVEQKHVDVASGFDGATGGGEHVAPHQAVNTGDTDCAQEPADRRGNQTNDQRQQHRQGGEDHAALVRRLFVVDGHRRQDEHDDDEQRGQADQNDVQRDLVRRQLAARALDHPNHAVEEGIALPRR